MVRDIAFLLALFCSVALSRITIENNGYRNIVIALPRNTAEDERPRIVQSIEDMLRSSSIILQMSTKGRAYFSEVSLLVPDLWKFSEGDMQSWEGTTFNFTTFRNSRPSGLATESADVIVTEKGQYPYVLHQGGCGKPARRFILPKDFLFRSQDKGRIFTRLWSEYRYGVFPEGGFQGDDRYPATYRSPATREQAVTGCSDKTFWSSDLCKENDKRCAETSLTSSLMNQHLSSSAIHFCEGSVSLGPKHNAESPSKQNLLCKEEGTWFTVMKNADFAHGKNAAPRYLPFAADVSFRFIPESTTASVTVAIEISSRMLAEKRYAATQAAFYHFVYSTLPYGSELKLFVFGDEDGVRLARQTTILGGEDSRILFVETQPLPEEASISEEVSFADLFDEIFKTNGDLDELLSSDIVIVTTLSHINATTYSKVKQKVLETESQLHILSFSQDEEQMDNDFAPLWDLCLETDGSFVSLQGDPLAQLYRGFSKAVGSLNKDVQIMLSYLTKDSDVDIEVPFVVDEELTENLKVYLFFRYLDVDHLQYSNTLLHTPSGTTLNFMKLEFLSAWEVDLSKAEAGKYVLKTRRIEGVTAPVLLSVMGRSKSEEEDPITVNVWTEITDFKVAPKPVQIFAEVRKGWHPISGAQVLASVQHPDGKTSELTLLDDGLGDVDITKDDGIYGRYFTDFSVPGYYNVHVKVSKGVSDTKVLRGPDGFCCGSFFSHVTAQSIGIFQREAGPATFHTSNFKFLPGEDSYPPSRVTDLKLLEKYDRICILQWTAVGDDLDSGFVETYELKMFRDPALIHNRFSGSRQEVYSEVIETTEEAVYGKTLVHLFQLPSNVSGGVYFFAIRGIDDAENAGEPSNIVPVWIDEDEESPRTMDCI